MKGQSTEVIWILRAFVVISIAFIMWGITQSMANKVDIKIDTGEHHYQEQAASLHVMEQAEPRGVFTEKFEEINDRECTTDAPGFPNPYRLKTNAMDNCNTDVVQHSYGHIYLLENDEGAYTPHYFEVVEADD